MIKLGSNYEPHFLYRLYYNNSVVYIGITNSINNRMRRHRIDKLFNYYSFEIISKEDAVKLESELVSKFKPKYNLIQFKRLAKKNKPSKPVNIPHAFEMLYNDIINKIIIRYKTQTNFNKISSVSKKTIITLYSYGGLSSSTLIKIARDLNYTIYIIANNEEYEYNEALLYLTHKGIKTYTVAELCEFLNVSKKTLIEFRKGNILRFDLLIQYAALLGDEILFTLGSDLK